MKSPGNDLLLIAGKVLTLLMQGVMGLASAAIALVMIALPFYRDSINIEARAEFGAAVTDMPLGSVLALLAVVCVLCALVFLFFGKLRGIIDTVAAGDPFVPENADRLSAMGWILIGIHVLAFASKAVGYGLPALRVDGNDFLAVWAATQWAEERARANLGATVIELFTYRGAPHSTSDDPSRYRPGDEFEKWPLGDPVARLKQHLIALGEWSDEQHEAELKAAEEKVRAAGKEAEAVGTLGQSRPSVTTMFEDVYATEDWRLVEQRREVGI